MASVLLTHENLSGDKHVEGLLFPCLDEGSTPSSSTDWFSQKATPKRQTLQNQRFVGFFHLPTLYLSCYLRHNLAIKRHSSGTKS